MDSTKRVQNGHTMSLVEKEEFMKVIVDMPWLYEPIIKEVDLHKDKIKSILDVGCGNGFLLGSIHNKYPDVLLMGIDIDEFFIQKAKENFQYDFHVADGYSFLQKADLVISNLALHHFDNPQLLIEHMVEQSNYGIIICDQVRPETDDELNLRIEKRLAMHDFGKSEYYKQRGKESILEAYSKNEINNLLSSLKIPFELKFINEDYFERFILTILK